MKKLYEKNELTFALLWIVVYCVLQSLANPLNKRIGIGYSASAAFCILQAVILIAFIRKNHLQKRYGLCKSPVPACRFLYYVPLLLLASENLWNGIALNYSLPETICRIVCMLCVGFLEEMIFRGLLFAAIAKDNVKSAIVISSVTFGIGHIITCSTAAVWNWSTTCARLSLRLRWAFCWSRFFYRGGSLLPCILVHSAINTLGTFASDAGLTMEMRLLHLGALIAITVAYTLILTRTLPKKAKKIHK
ncbi:MAG: CPBP family intramembrane glutamic endopeptidase [Faecalibacterium sp.]